MKLIREEAIEHKHVIVENKVTGNNDYFIEGIFLQAEKVNKNKRLYPREIMKESVNRYIKEFVKDGRAYGELDHPDEPSIKLSKVSHLIVDLQENGDDYWGKAKISNEGNGKVVKGLIDMGSNLGVSSRALGSLQMKEGVNIVQPDFYIVTAADIVANPSAPDAFVQGIMENKEWLFVNGEYIEEDIDNAKKAIRKATREDKETYIKLFEDFLNKIR